MGVPSVVSLPAWPHGRHLVQSNDFHSTMNVSSFLGYPAGYCRPPSTPSMLIPRPNFTYIELIAKAILSTKDMKMAFSEICDWIRGNYAYFRNHHIDWRNTIRYTLSINDCFIKLGRSWKGKSHYWGIHPANVEDFRHGDFRRRLAQRQVRRALGLSYPGEGDDTNSPRLFVQLLSPCFQTNSRANQTYPSVPSSPK